VDSISFDSLDGEATAAIRAVSEAMFVARSLEGRAAASVKADTSPVTVADLAIQAIIASRLCQDFPRDALIAEEDASLLHAEPDGVLSRQVVEIVRHVIRDANRKQIVTWIERGRLRPFEASIPSLRSKRRPVAKSSDSPPRSVTRPPASSINSDPAAWSQTESWKLASGGTRARCCRTQRGSTRDLRVRQAGANGATTPMAWVGREQIRRRSSRGRQTRLFASH
jgi:3'-phosphoadenosine 5'-phosphosulfate (PAPS) 3'-phosphatase